jgi:hypothetical protein
MSPLTIFLAKFLGLYCIILALAINDAQERRRFCYSSKCSALLAA